MRLEDSSHHPNDQALIIPTPNAPSWISYLPILVTHYNYIKTGQHEFSQRLMLASVFSDSLIFSFFWKKKRRGVSIERGFFSMIFFQRPLSKSLTLSIAPGLAKRPRWRNQVGLGSFWNVSSQGTHDTHGWIQGLSAMMRGTEMDLCPTGQNIFEWSE